MLQSGNTLVSPYSKRYVLLVMPSSLNNIRFLHSTSSCLTSSALPLQYKSQESVNPGIEYHCTSAETRCLYGWLKVTKRTKKKTTLWLGGRFSLSEWFKPQSLAAKILKWRHKPKSIAHAFVCVKIRRGRGFNLGVKKKKTQWERQFSLDKRRIRGTKPTRTLSSC